MSLSFRTATSDDAGPIQHLVESAFRAIDDRQDWTGNAQLAAHFRLDIKTVVTKIADPNIITLMALDNDTLVASIEVSKRGDCGRLSMIAVAERYQQGGFGRQVLEYGEEYCQRTWGVTTFSLNALSTRKALIHWYMRRGYRETGETSPFPRDEFAELDLPQDLCFVELEKDLLEK